jgi:hypothetical protein
VSPDEQLPPSVAETLAKISHLLEQMTAPDVVVRVAANDPPVQPGVTLVIDDAFLGHTADTVTLSTAGRWVVENWPG